MFVLIFLIMIGTTIWVGYDAHLNQVSIDDKPYSVNNGAIAWVVSCIIIWIATFPLYLYKRAKALGQRQQNPTVGVSSAEEITKYKKLFDDGIITNEEFEFKKKQLLGLDKQ